MTKTQVAIIGSGNIGTDLMFKVLRLSEILEVGAMVGIDPDSDGLARAVRLGIPTTHEGVDGLIALPNFADIGIVLDATSAGAHRANAAKLAPFGKKLIDPGLLEGRLRDAQAAPAVGGGPQAGPRLA